MEAKVAAATPIRVVVLTSDGEAISTNDFVKEKIVIGRILSADVRIDDPRVSRIHALIEIKDGKVVLTDLASSHGTFLNGKKVIEATLKFGDVIRLGFVDVRVEKGTGKTSSTVENFEKTPVHDGDETRLEIDRSLLDEMDRRKTVRKDRRRRDAFPEERRLDDRRAGDRRIEQRSGEERRDTAAEAPVPPKGQEERRSKNRRDGREYERRVGERRRNDRRVFDITSLERRIVERRARGGDDDLLPEELEKAFAPPEHARELEVTALWGEHILDVSNYVDPIVLTVGESPTNHYIIPSVGISDEFPLVTVEEDGTAHLAFTKDMTGTIRARDKIYTVSELINAKFCRKFASYYVVALKRDDFAKLSIGNINFFILYVKPAPRILPPPLLHADPMMTRTAIGSLLLLILMLVGVSLVPKPKPVTIEMIPERFARIVIKRRPKIPDAIVSKTDKPQQGGSVKGEGAKAKDDAGKAGKVDKPKKEVTQQVTPKKKITKPTPTPQRAKAPARQRKVVNKEQAKSVGLLKAFKNSGIKSNLKDLGTDGGFENFGKAVSGLRSNSIDGGGAGGKGLKGVNAGGGGNTIGIDGPSTKGLGRGGSGSGAGEGIAGPGRLGQKGEHTISIISENVQVLSGLPKDVINAVVQRHRAEVRACYDAALQRNPNIRGKVVVAFDIQPNGIVSKAVVKESSVGDSALSRCITSRVKSWVFPKPEAPVVTEVSAYPFYLSPAN